MIISRRVKFFFLDKIKKKNNDIYSSKKRKENFYEK